MKISDEAQKALEDIIDHFDMEDIAVRQRQIAFWKKLDYFWNNIQRIYWDSTNHDWRVFDAERDVTDDSYFYDKPINVFKAFLETIIAALSSVVPPVKCYPQDANVDADIQTAKGGSQIADMVYQEQDAILIFTKILFTYCLQGMVAVYSYLDKDEKYGTVSMPQYKDVEEEQDVAYCPRCKMVLQGQDKIIAEELDDLESNEFDPGDDDAESHSAINKEKQGQLLCPNCLMQVDPEFRKEKVIITRLDGITDEPKSKICIEPYGGLFVKIPNYARTQDEIPCLRLSYEQHYTKILDEFPDLKADEIKNAEGVNQPLERWGRLSTQYLGEYPMHTPTVNKYWLRPFTFHMVNDDKIKAELFEKFPDGAYVVIVGDMFVLAENQSLDDHWTITKNPLSNYLHFDPAGSVLVAVQEITNDIVSLVLQTMEQGIGQTFVESGLLDLEAYKEGEAMVGGIYPVKTRGGKPIEQSFFQLKAANLSKEVEPFGEKIQELGQFTSGALPSLSGAPQQSSSRTAAQYAMSRSQSLQRLQSPWKMVTILWKEVFSKVIPAYIKEMLDDDTYVKEDNGSFVNVVIEKAKMDGKIGRVVLQSAEQLPLSQGQIKDIIMQLLQMPNPEIMQALSLPENLPLLQEALGLQNFVLPGEDDREKQYAEIQLLLKSAPVPTAMGQEMPAIMPEMLVDNHAVEGEICRNWLVSAAGREAKINNPEGYKNILLHLKAHMSMLQQMKAAFPEAPAAPEKGAPAPPKPAAKVQENQ